MVYSIPHEEPLGNIPQRATLTPVPQYLPGTLSSSDNLLPASLPNVHLSNLPSSERGERTPHCSSLDLSFMSVLEHQGPENTNHQKMW